ncbi:MAG: T9SS type A sorting domain-containing protein [Salinivirgaceae bacterium]|jgi:hypothetical protein|nr:T9SS type A sorting domain-containing protein [Salinivirgaceae bacterium]
MIKSFFIVILLLANATSQLTAQSHKILSERHLGSDGQEGIETYALIKSVLGPNPIEAPDLYSDNHPDVKHIIEENDSIVGNHFTFLIHRDIDKDRDTDNTDRQRNEIKAYSGSDDELKAFSGESLRYHWYFQLEKNFSISNNFSHFFQLKAVGGSYSSQPVVTISGSINSSKQQFEIIHSRLTGSEDEQLANTNWDRANTGEWMEIEVLATYKDSGYLKVSITNLNGDTILSTENKKIDMWREGSEFVRPKWGIYRSLSTKQFLNEDEERARFANFTVQKVILNYIPTPPYAAINPYPLNNGEYIDTAFTFNWITGTNTTYSKLFLGKSNELNLSNLVDSTFNSMLSIDALVPNTNYYWRVDVVNEDGITKGELWHFKTAPKATNCSESNILAINEVNASTELTEYPKISITDNNLETGWGFAGEQQWIELNLGIEANLSYLMLAFYQGDERYHNFEIHASSDQVNYSTLATYRSFGISLNLQKVLVPETSAQFIRFVSTDTFSTAEPLVMEMYAFGCGGQIDKPTHSELIYPEQNAENIATSIILSWNAGIGAKSHKLYLGTNETLTDNDLASETNNTFFDIKDLNPKQTYYWRVDELNEAGTTTGEIWSFTTTYEITELLIQENEAGFISLDGTIENTHTGYTGDGYADSNDESGASISWKAIAVDNTYMLKWNYANASSSNASAFVKINDKAVGIINFVLTENWNTWALDSVNVSLVEGENTITLSALGSAGLANIDYLLIRGENITSVTPVDLNITTRSLINPYPNPCTSILNIAHNGLNNSNAQIEIYDLSGKIMYNKNVTTGTVKNEISININHLEKGLYIIFVKTAEQSVSRKFIKK